MHPVSFIQLGFRFFSAVLRSLLRTLLRQSHGLETFSKRYGPDRLPVLVTQDARPSDFSNCVSCGRCDALAKTDVSSFVLANSRSSTDFDIAMRSVDTLEKLDLAMLEANCPTHVPFRKLLKYCREIHTRIESSNGTQ